MGTYQRHGHCQMQIPRFSAGNNKMPSCKRCWILQDGQTGSGCSSCIPKTAGARLGLGFLGVLGAVGSSSRCSAGQVGIACAFPGLFSDSLHYHRAAKCTETDGLSRALQRRGCCLQSRRSHGTRRVANSRKPILSRHILGKWLKI